VPGLRARKKQRTVTAILDAALALMTRRGFEATTMEAIAERAEVSVGTLYNQFGSKGAVLLGILASSTADVVERSAAIVDAPGSDARAAVRSLMLLYVDSLAHFDRDLLRTAMSLAFVAPPDVSAEVARLDMSMIERISALVATLQARGSIAAELSSETVAMALYGTFAIAMITWMVMPGADSASLRRSLDEQLAVTFHGLEPRPKKRSRS
jgi:AcrR family transcriptional regulator